VPRSLKLLTDQSTYMEFYSERASEWEDLVCVAKRRCRWILLLPYNLPIVWVSLNTKICLLHDIHISDR
jgi:hypothetical protein